MYEDLYAVISTMYKLYTGSMPFMKGTVEACLSGDDAALILSNSDYLADDEVITAEKWRLISEQHERLMGNVKERRCASQGLPAAMRKLAESVWAYTPASGSVDAICKQIEAECKK
jgi:hypothetical protein